ncbi:hypothetical protein [Alicyclobacillus fodiniaquatilis]|jgi:hypothetical protein|uniref:Uncharacterized protein n=1 Tax=Alicyclobacillus fodiniaquatilis TaxID=1661150 RepID=A0ABW4JR76_9BACL
MTNMAQRNIHNPVVPNCRGCTASAHVSAEAIARMADQTAALPDLITAVEDYTERMKACQTCESLQFGTTCRWCGCLVAIKAKRAAARCPHPQGSRW